MDTRHIVIDGILGRWIVLSHYHHYLLPIQSESLSQRTACGVSIAPTWSPRTGQMSLSRCDACLAKCREHLAPVLLAQ